MDKQTGDLFTGEIPEYRDDFDKTVYAKAAFRELCRFHYRGLTDYLEATAEEVASKCDSHKDAIIGWLDGAMTRKSVWKPEESCKDPYHGWETLYVKELSGMMR